jgi:transposase InsO family protein
MSLFITILLLCGLTEDYDTFRITIESRDILPDLHNVKIKIMEENARHKEKIGEIHVHQQNELMFTKDKSKNSENIGRKRENNNIKLSFKCFKCGKKGHKANNCWTKQENRSKLARETLMNSISESDALNRNQWYLDSGATSHMCGDKSQFISLSLQENQKVQLATEDMVQVRGKGIVKLKIHSDQNIGQLKLQNVLYVPEIQNNLLSVSKMTDWNIRVIFEKDKARAVNNKGEIVLRAKKIGNLYVLQNLISNLHVTRDRVGMSCEKENSMVWHFRLGHLNFKDVKKLKDDEMVRDLSLGKMDKEITCETCIKGKQTRLPFPKSTENSKRELLELIHTDICGPMRVTSPSGARYFITFIDDMSRHTTVYTIKERSHALDCFKRYKQMSEKRTGKVIKILRSDNGAEYCSNAFRDYLNQNGIKRELNVEYSPQQNGVAERMNRTLLNVARCLLIEAKFPEMLWAEMINTATYLRNRCPTRINNAKTPQELWTKIKPTVSHLRIIGSRVFARNNKPNKGKFSPRSEEYVMIGYSPESKAYRLWKRGTKNVIKARDVKFLEPNTFNSSQRDFQLYDTTEENELENPITESLFKEEKNPTIECLPDEQEIMGDLISEEEEEEQGIEFLGDSLKRGPGRPKMMKTGKRGRPKKEYNLIKEAAKLLKGKSKIPESVGEALNGPNSKEWSRAMAEEYDSLVQNNTWDLVELPKDRKPIGSRWVFTIKYEENGEISHYKARLVAKGFTQKYGSGLN